VLTAQRLRLPAGRLPRRALGDFLRPPKETREWAIGLRWRWAPCPRGFQDTPHAAHLHAWCRTIIAFDELDRYRRRCWVPSSTQWSRRQRPCLPRIGRCTLRGGGSTAVRQETTDGKNMRDSSTWVLLALVHLLGSSAIVVPPPASPWRAAGCCASHSVQDDHLAAIHARLEELAKAGTFSGSVLIARRGEVLYQRGFGFADRKAGIVNTERTQFNICSMGKMFTATAMMLLVEDGLVDLHAPISTYLPDFPNDMGEQITVHQLLSHTAGLGNYMATEEFVRRMAELTTIDQLYELVKREQLQAPPGTSFHYSNSGFVVAGEIIEVVSGRSYFDFVRERIFAPLSMNETAFYLASRRPRGVALGYTREDGAFEREAHRAPNPASDGGVHSTVGDLFLFDRAVHGARLMSPTSRDMMFAPNLNGYGYGFSIKPPEEHVSGRTSIGHTGGLLDRSTVLRHFVDDDTVIIVLSNFPAIAFEVAREIEGLLFRTP
jgi:CubicO group peptidase (beta-lactamase class C family)